MIYISVVDLRTLFFCYAQGPGPFADYRHGTVTPSLAAYIFLAAKAMSLLSAESMEGLGHYGQSQTPGQGQDIVFAILGVVGVQSHRRECLSGLLAPLGL